MIIDQLSCAARENAVAVHRHNDTCIINILCKKGIFEKKIDSEPFHTGPVVQYFYEKKSLHQNHELVKILKILPGI